MLSNLTAAQLIAFSVYLEEERGNDSDRRSTKVSTACADRSDELPVDAPAPHFL
jgi:hypothetical protein